MAYQNEFLEELVKQYTDAKNTLYRVESSEHLTISDSKTIARISERNFAKLLNLYVKQYHLDIGKFKNEKNV